MKVLERKKNFWKETKKIEKKKQNKKFRWKPKILEGNQNKKFRRKLK